MRLRKKKPFISKVLADTPLCIDNDSRPMDRVDEDPCQHLSTSPISTTFHQDSIGQCQCKVKLPKLSIRKFNGDLTLWTTFWDSFESAIHNNRNLSAIDKFNYLNSLLEECSSVALLPLILHNV